MSALADLLSRIDAFLARTGMSESRFGREVCNDGALVADMRSGREPRLSTIERVERFMAEYRPELRSAS